MERRLITKDTDDDTRLTRISGMQQDLGLLLREGWCDVDPRIQVAVLHHAVTEITRGLTR